MHEDSRDYSQIVSAVWAIHVAMSHDGIAGDDGAAGFEWIQAVTEEIGPLLEDV
jgi:hypothetical protein